MSVFPLLSHFFLFRVYIGFVSTWKAFESAFEQNKCRVLAKFVDYRNLSSFNIYYILFLFFFLNI